MSTLEMKTFESALQARAEELARSAGTRSEITIEGSADEFEAALLAADRESSARMLEQDFRLLRQVEAALDRMRDGTFGVCQRCEEEIARKRLQAIPWAIYCVSCQAKAEGDEAYWLASDRAA